MPKAGGDNLPAATQTLPSSTTTPQLARRRNYWASAKSNMTRFAHGGERRSLARSGRSYVRARGGAAAGARSSVASRSATSRLAGFLSTVATSGTTAALNQLGLSTVVGQSAETILGAVAEAIAPEGALLKKPLHVRPLTMCY
jgi:hypothetical protein